MATLKNGKRVLGDEEIHPLFKATLTPDVTLIGFNLSLLPTKTDELRRASQGLFDLWKSGRIRPTLGPRFSFLNLPEAHGALASRSTTGKVLIQL